MNYFITALNSKESSYSRCFGYFTSLDDSVEAIENNKGDMNEAGYYDYLILESIGPGIHPMVSQVILFKWENNKWQEVKMWPEWFPKNVTNFALG